MTFRYRVLTSLFPHGFHMLCPATATASSQGIRDETKLTKVKKYFEDFRF